MLKLPVHNPVSRRPIHILAGIRTRGLAKHLAVGWTPSHVLLNTVGNCPALDRPPLRGQ